MNSKEIFEAINDEQILKRKEQNKMAKTVELEKETLSIAQIGEFGVRVGDEWYGVNDPLEPSDFVGGKTYDVLIKRGKPSEKYPQGKKYIAQVVGESVPTTAKTATTSVASGVGDEKGTRILRQGVYQATLQSSALAGFAATPDEYLALVKTTAERVISFIENK